MEVVVERGFLKMGQIMTEKRCSLDDNSLDLLMRISHNKESLLRKTQAKSWIFGQDFQKEESSVISCEYCRNSATVETIIIFELYCIDIVIPLSISKPFLFVDIFYFEMFIYKVIFYYKYTVFFIRILFIKIIRLKIVEKIRIF